MDETTRSQSISILHLSDLHFGETAPKAEYSAGITKSPIDTLLSHLETQAVRPEMVIVSGDLTATGQGAEFRLAAEALDAICRGLGISRDAVVVVPGNHDVYWGKGTAATRAEFDGFASRFYDVSVAKLGIQTARVRDVFALGLDSTRLLSQELGGLGLVGDDQLDKALASVKEAADAGTKILVLHHQLLPVVYAERDPNEVHSLSLDSNRVLGWAQENGFAVVLHGHQHQPFAATHHNLAFQGGPIAVLGGPSFGSSYLPAQARNGLQVLEVDGRSIRRALHYFTLSASLEVGDVREFVRQRQGVFATSALPAALSFSEPTVDEIRVALLNLSGQVVASLASSYGPCGGYRGVTQPGGTTSARDGLGILSSLRARNAIEERLLKEIVTITQELSERLGDGRKTQALLISEILRLALEDLRAGASDIDLAHSLKEASIIAVRELQRTSRPFDPKGDLLPVALTACSDPELAAVAADAFTKAGPDGLVRIRPRVDGAPAAPSVSVRPSPRFTIGVPDWYDPAEDLLKPYVLVYGAKLFWSDDLLAVVEAAKTANRSLFLAGTEVDAGLHPWLRTNYTRGVVTAVPAVLGRMSASHEDLAAVSGTRVLRPDLGDSLKRLPIGALGAAESIIFEERSSVVVQPLPGNREGWRSHIDRLRSDVSAPTLGAYERDAARERLAAAAGSIVDIAISRSSRADAALAESMLKDALAALSAAAIKGVVSGGGEGYASAARELDATAQMGAKILARALELPKKLLETSTARSVALDAASVVTSVVQSAVDASRRLLLTRSLELPAPE